MYTSITFFLNKTLKKCGYSYDYNNNGYNTQFNLPTIHHPV